MNLGIHIAARHESQEETCRESLRAFLAIDEDHVLKGVFCYRENYRSTAETMFCSLCRQGG